MMIVSVFVFAVFLNALFLLPILAHFSTHLTSYQDGLFIAWTINWVKTAFLTGANPYQAPLFLPFTNTLTFSDPFFSTALLSIPVNWFFSNIVALHNFHLVIGSLAVFLGMFLLANHMFKSTQAGLFSALVFSFSSMHLHYLVHLHTFLIAGVPLGVYFFLRWQETRRLRWLMGAGIAFLYQALNAPMTGFFFVACTLPFIKKTDLQQLMKPAVLVTSTFFLVIPVLAYIPYFQTADTFNYTRSIREATHFAHSIDRFWDTEILVILATFLVFAVTSPKKNYQKRIQALTLVGLLFSLGPALKFQDQTVKFFSLPIPLPYGLLFYLVPGLKAFRATSRWITVFNLGLSLVLGSSVATSKLSSQIKFLTLIGLSGFLLWYNQPSLQLEAIPTTVPPVYQTVKAQSQDTLIELPIFIWDDHPFVREESRRLLYQTYHQKTLYNGYSGFTPPQRELDFPWLRETFPETATLEHLQQNSVSLVLVHFDQYQIIGKNADDLKQQISQSPALKLIRCQESTCLYQISPSAKMNE